MRLTNKFSLLLQTVHFLFVRRQSFIENCFFPKKLTTIMTVTASTNKDQPYRRISTSGQCLQLTELREYMLNSEVMVSGLDKRLPRGDSLKARSLFGKSFFWSFLSLEYVSIKERQLCLFRTSTSEFSFSEHDLV